MYSRRLKIFLLFSGLMLMAILTFGQNGIHYSQQQGEERFRTIYVHSFQELIKALQTRTSEKTAFFFSYDGAGHIIHAVPILIENLISFLIEFECDLPPFCTVLIDNEAIRKVE